MRKVLLAAAATVGLVAVAFIARAVAFRASGFDPDTAAQNSDCDQCTLTETLNVLPWIALACLVYLAAVALLAVLVFRRTRHEHRTTEPVHH